MDVKKALQGDEWLGHPLHPALVALPIGMWTLSLALDGVAALSKNECVQEAADFAMVGGLLSAGVTAATGIAEYTRVPTEGRVLNQALLHGSLNASAVTLYGINAMIRQGRRRAGRPGGFLPKLLSLAGAAIIGYSGWLGGGMVYNHGVAVRKGAGTEEPSQTQGVRRAKEQREQAPKAHV